MMSKGLVKSHDNIHNAKTRITPNQVFYLIGWFKQTKVMNSILPEDFRVQTCACTWKTSGTYANRKQNKRRLPVTVIIMTLYQILARQSIIETVGCLVEQD